MTVKVLHPNWTFQRNADSFSVPDVDSNSLGSMNLYSQTYTNTLDATTCT